MGRVTSYSDKHFTCAVRNMHVLGTQVTWGTPHSGILLFFVLFFFHIGYLCVALSALEPGTYSVDLEIRDLPASAT